MQIDHLNNFSSCLCEIMAGKNINSLRSIELPIKLIFHESLIIWISPYSNLASIPFDELNNYTLDLKISNSLEWPTTYPSLFRIVYFL
jgi:hypothetical protein